MADKIDNARLCEKVLGWKQVGRIVPMWETPAGLTFWQPPDFEHDIAAAMGLVFALREKHPTGLVIQIVSPDSRHMLSPWYCVIEQAGKRPVQICGETPAQAITWAVWALVNNEDAANA